MSEAGPHHDAHRPQVPVEELALRYQVDHDPDAAHELLRRCQPLRIATVRQVVRRYRVLRPDWPDLAQVANLAILEAGERYRPPHAFLTLARLVIRCRCSNRMQSAQRAESHFDRGCDVAVLADGQALPDQAALRQERCQRVAQVFRQLDPREQRLWEALAADLPLARIARVFGMSPRRAKCWTRQFCAKIRLLLPEEQA